MQTLITLYQKAIEYYSAVDDNLYNDVLGRMKSLINRPEIDDWELRRGLNELHGHDLVPEPKILIAAFKACRRLNDTAMAIRILEAVKVSSSNAFTFTFNISLESTVKR